MNSSFFEIRKSFSDENALPFTKIKKVLMTYDKILVSSIQVFWKPYYLSF